MASELRNERKAWSVLIVSTLAFTVCFMVWMMFGVIGIPIKKMLNLNSTEFGLLTAMPVLTGSLVRVPLGIWTDRYGGRIVMAILMAITVLTVNGPTTFHIGLNVYAFTGLMAVLGIAFAFGKASVFKYISDDYPKNIGAISGIVGLAGGMGGFVLPILFGMLMDWTGIRSSAFMLMYGVVWVSLIWMYFTEVRRTNVMAAA